MEGPHVVAVVVGNRSLERNLTVAPDPDPRPDLGILALDGRTEAGMDIFEAQFYEPGERAAFNATVVNRGRVAAGPFRVEVFLDNRTIGNASAQALEPGQTLDVRSDPWTIVGGWHLLTVAVDRCEGVAERHEGDNDNDDARTFHIEVFDPSAGPTDPRELPTPDRPPLLAPECAAATPGPGWLVTLAGAVGALLLAGGGRRVR